MSGGVGPCSDINLPKDEQETHQQNENQNPSLPKSTTGRGGFLSFRQLNCLAVIIVFAASGLVSLEDSVFVVFSLIYIFFLSKVAFPCLTNSKEPRVFDPNNKILRLYVLIGAIIGLFLPIGYIFEGIWEGDKEGIKAAAPHVFLLASQVFMEGVVFSHGFSIPIRVLVPVFYNAKRILTIMEWLTGEITKVDEEYGGSKRRLYVGRALAIANMGFWSFNLFGFLVPVYLPIAFKKYYSASKLQD